MKNTIDSSVKNTVGSLIGIPGPHFLNLKSKEPDEVIERLAFASENLVL